MSNLSASQFDVQTQPPSVYTNVAMQMVPPSAATNTVSGTKA
jgi:hypothetical protein